MLIKNLFKLILRKKTPVILYDQNRAFPISSLFGTDRGTPIDRYYITQFLQGNSFLIRGCVLEIADSHYTTLFGGAKVDKIEVLHVTNENKKATIIGDLTDASTLPCNRVDCFICTQTFNFIFDLHKAVIGVHQILKPGGVLLATVAGISQISRYDMTRWGDYWRFTTLSVQKLFSPIFSDGVEVSSYGNALAAISFLQGVAVEDLHDPTLLDVPDPDYQVIIAIKAVKGTL